MPKVKAWHAVIGHLEYEACVKALHQHQRTSSEYLMPAHIVQLVTPKPHPDDWMNR